MKLSLDELKTSFLPFRYLAPNEIEFHIGRGVYKQLWIVAWSHDGWRVVCDQGERSFSSDQEAFRYFWDRALAPHDVIPDAP